MPCWCCQVWHRNLIISCTGTVEAMDGDTSDIHIEDHQGVREQVIIKSFRFDMSNVRSNVSVMHDLVPLCWPPASSTTVCHSTTRLKKAQTVSALFTDIHMSEKQVCIFKWNAEGQKPNMELESSEVRKKIQARAQINTHIYLYVCEYYMYVSICMYDSIKIYRYMFWI